jgi:hypothetical protein
LQSLLAINGVSDFGPNLLSMLAGVSGAPGQSTLAACLDDAEMMDFDAGTIQTSPIGRSKHDWRTLIRGQPNHKG